MQLSKAVQCRIDYSSKLRIAIFEYLDQLVIKKAKEVEVYMVDYFKKLSKKGNQVQDYFVNPNTFEVQFMDKYGEVMPKRRLSAGEKLIYAVSLVWSLASASKKILPIVIDTPLGRLDRVHKSNMLTKYFPYASKQVIILSTDSEVYGEWKELIKPYIAKEYIILDNGIESKIVPGYFDMGGISNEPNTNIPV